MEPSPASTVASRRRKPHPIDRALGAWDRACDAGARGVERVLATRPAAYVKLVVCARWFWLLVILGALGFIVAPEVAVRRARARATRCLAEAKEKGLPVVKSCGPIVRDFDYPTKTWYTRHDATYRAEELIARIAIQRYQEAAIGDPDPVRLAEAANEMKRTQELVDAGSRRISLEELGPAVGAPHLGKLASAVGDRAALIGNPAYFGLWYTRRDVVEATMIEADFEHVDWLATKYAHAKPTDADLKSILGAALCIASPEEGFALLKEMPAQRAGKRYENLQRNFGELFAVLEACAAKLGEFPQSMPANEGAGVGDLPMLRRLTELRVSLPGEDRASRVARAKEILSEGEGDPIDQGQPFARAMLLAAVLTLDDGTIEPAFAARMATPDTDGGEGPLAPRAATLRSILVRAPGLYPIVPAPWLVHAGKRLQELSLRAVGTDVGKLERAASAMFVLASIEFSLDGELEPSIAAAGAAAMGGQMPERLRALAQASVAYVAGDPARALSILTASPSPKANDTDADVELSIDALTALVAASSGDQDLAKKKAALLPVLARDVRDADLSLFARWVAVALAPASVQEGAPAALVSTGQADPLARYRDRGAVPIDLTLRAWARAASLPPAEQRLFRYQAWEKKGDAPSLALPFIVAADHALTSEASDPHEVWLDAITAVDARRMRLRSYAFMRKEAARIRGDARAAADWEDRLEVLREVAKNEDDMDAARFLRL